MDDVLDEVRSCVSSIETMGRSAIWMCGPDDPDDPASESVCWSSIVLGEIDDDLAEAAELLGTIEQPDEQAVRFASAVARMKAIRSAGFATCTEEECYGYDHADEIVAVAREALGITPEMVAAQNAAYAEAAAERTAAIDAASEQGPS